jgi:hypothetical protein
MWLKPLLLLFSLFGFDGMVNSCNPHSADTKANLGIKNLEKEKPEKID